MQGALSDTQHHRQVGKEEDLPTRDRILLWTTLIMLVLAVLTTPPSLTWPAYFLQLVAACLLLVVILVPGSSASWSAVETRPTCSALRSTRRSCTCNPFRFRGRERRTKWPNQKIGKAGCLNQRVEKAGRSNQKAGGAG